MLYPPQAVRMYEDHLEWRRRNWPILKNDCATELEKGMVRLYCNFKKGGDILGTVLLVFFVPR